MEAELGTARGVWTRRDEVQLLDVREQWEWDAGHIEGSVHVPLQELMDGAMPVLEPGKPVIAVCTSGRRSEVARLLLEARGFRAHNLERGLEEWVAEGLPLAAPDGAPGVLA